MQTESRNDAQTSDTYPNVETDDIKIQTDEATQEQPIREEDTKAEKNVKMMSAADYAIGLLIFMLPVAGAVVSLIWACSSRNNNRKNFGKALVIIRIVIWIAAAAIIFAMTGLFSDLLFDILT